MRKLFTSIVLAACCIHGGSVGASPSAAPGGAQESANWQKHEYSFAFLGFTSTYSCDGLADKLKLLLTAAGARSDLKATPGACASGFGRPDKFARANLTFYTLASGADDGAPGAGGKLAAVWHPVELTAHRPFDLGPGDCELVEQFTTHLLPLFTTRNVESHTTCVPHQESGSVIDLRFETLMPPAKSANH